MAGSDLQGAGRRDRRAARGEAAMSSTVVLAGCGNMGFAMLTGWLESGRLLAAEVWVVEPDAALRSRAAGLGVKAVADAGAIAAAAPRLVVLAVKPQVILRVAGDYRRFAEGRTTTFLSIAAGTPMAALEKVLGAVPLVRCMPNTPAAIGKGMMVTVDNGRVPAPDAAFIDGLLAASGAVTAVADEQLMDAVTAVSGSGPAYVFHFLE